MRNLAVFMTISLFAGSIVFVAAKDIQNRLAPASDTDRAALQEILKDIQGEKVIPAVKAVMPKEAMPARSNGSYLVRRDIDRLKKFIMSFVSPEEVSPSESEAGDTK